MEEVDWMGEPWKWEQEKSSEGRLKGFCERQVKWCGGSNLGRTRNLGPWKFPAIYESDPSKYPSNGEFESEMAIYCNQARLPMERFGEQLSPQIFNPIFVQPTR